MRKVIVVGGGAAGLMAVSKLQKNGVEVMLLEKIIAWVKIINHW